MLATKAISQITSVVLMARNMDQASVVAGMAGKL
jgi:hypothetical protein